MADLNNTQATEATRIVGADATTGVEQTPVQSTTAGGLHANIRDSAGVEAGTKTNPVLTAPGRDTVIAECTTATPLAAGGVFTASTADLSLLNGSEITIMVFTNVASAALGMRIEWSNDSVNFDHVESYTISAMTAGQAKIYTNRKKGRYLRIVYTNGGTIQTTFRLTTTLNVLSSKPSSHRLDTTNDANDDATLVKSVLVGERVDGVFDNVKSTNENEIANKQSPEPLYDVTHKANRLLNGAAFNMNVNGSVTPQSFRFTPAAGETWFLKGLALGIQDGGAQDTTLFGNLGALTNGLQINVRTNGVVYELTNIKDNFDITMFFSGLNGGGASLLGLGGGWLDDPKVFVGSTQFTNPIKLSNATSDYVEIVVRDNLTGITNLRGYYSAQRRS